MSAIPSNVPGADAPVGVSERPRFGAAAYWMAAALLTVAGVLVVRYYTPNDAGQGVIQKIFYLHLPVAINTLAACLVVFIASIGYLSQHRMWWDDLAASAARVAVLLGGIVLLTGSIWAHSAWNTWWAWTPKLTFSLILWLLYVVQLMLRTSIESSQRRAIISAVYGVIAFLDVPLVYLSAKLIKDPFHPASVSMETSMKLTLIFWFVPVTMIAAGLIVARYKLARRQREAARRFAGDNV